MQVEVRGEGTRLLGEPTEPGLQFAFSLIAATDRRLEPDPVTIRGRERVSGGIDRGDGLGPGGLELMATSGLFREGLLRGGRFLSGFIDPGFDLRQFTPQFVDLDFELADPATLFGDRGFRIIPMAGGQFDALLRLIEPVVLREPKLFQIVAALLHLMPIDLRAFCFCSSNVVRTDASSRRVDSRLAS